MTVTIDGLTAARSAAIEAEAIVSGAVNGAGHLILTKFNGATLDAGNVKGSQGIQGPSGVITCTSTTRPAAVVGQAIWETDTKRYLIYNGVRWDPPWNTSWGWVAGVTLQNDITPAGNPPSAVLAASQATWAAIANRRYLVMVRSRVVSDTPGRVTAIVEDGGGGDIDDQSIYVDNGNAAGWNLSWSYHETGIPTGNVTRQLRYGSLLAAGSLHVMGTLGIGTQLHIFDDGPRGNPIA